MWEEVQRNYPINENYIWLNNCGISVMGKTVQKELQNYQGAFLEHSVLKESYSPMRLRKRIMSLLASLFNANENDFALVQNTAEGLNYIAYGLSLQKDDEILLLEDEYPSNVYPWKAQEKRSGAKVIFIPKSISAEDFLEALQKKITSKTRVISLSAVHWLTGLVYPLETVGEICRKNNILFCLDAAQGAGHVFIDPKKMNISFMAFSAWKWLMGPLGLGVLYISPEALERLGTGFLSTGSIVNDSEYLPYREQYKPNASRYEISTSNYMSWTWFAASLEYLDRIGFQEVQKRIYFLTHQLAGALSAIGFVPILPEYGKNGILTIVKGPCDLMALREHLSKNGVITAWRLGGIRMSPHVFISTEQIENVLTLFKEHSRK